MAAYGWSALRVPMMIWDKGQDWLRPNNKKQQETSKFEKEMLWLWQWKYVMFYAVPSLALASQKLIKKIQSMQIKSAVKREGCETVFISIQFSNRPDLWDSDHSVQHPRRNDVICLCFIFCYNFVLILSTVLTTRIYPLPSVDHSLTTRWPCQWPRWSWHLGAPWNVRPSVCRSGLVVSVRARPKPWIVRSVRCRLCF